jgi:hypothetical protein
VRDREYEEPHDAASVQANGLEGNHADNSSANISQVIDEKFKQVDNRIVGTFNDRGLFMIRRGDHKKIFYHFKPFYVHRV